MLTKAFIEERKLARDSQFFMKTLAPTNSEQRIKKWTGTAAELRARLD